MSNSIISIMPWKDRACGLWMFNDEALGLHKELFVQSAGQIIDTLTKDIPNAESGCVLLASDVPFPGHTMALDMVAADGYGGHVYAIRSASHIQGWLCPVLLQYFGQAPKSLYVQALPNKEK